MLKRKIGTEQKKKHIYKDLYSETYIVSQSILRYAITVVKYAPSLIILSLIILPLTSGFSANSDRISVIQHFPYCLSFHLGQENTASLFPAVSLTQSLCYHVYP